ncbi:hypothetical protein LL266_17775 [Vibrio anguillarum]|uniref:hypothetical protein n=1 Tax=Vibrio anguillarum TaxID=55601 RepID=UPI001695ED84|nr:hypothetical protein [Vibrio anguillarum]MCC4238328.1 hypothetical protein [Vibrio anguillarum]NOI07216.1 hypothetical protein [Vibrio anguillarum]
MSGTNLTPEKITSPFQLMAAWFAMLVLLSSVLLTAAVQIESPVWAAGYLVCFTSFVVIVVITCVFLMLTKFRPHLQDGKEYARWLKDQGQYTQGVRLPELASEGVGRVEDRNFLVSLLNTPSAMALSQKLKARGYNVEIYESPSPVTTEVHTSLSGHEGIWLGSRIPAREAINAIQLVLNDWSELKYIHLSMDGGDPPDYVHEQIFFGGSNKVVERYNLKPWTLKELMNLNPEISDEEFHRKIREKYS